MKKISLVIPMYNEEPMVTLLFDTLNEKVVKVLDGQYEVEVVAVNDGSTDKTLELLKEAQDKYSFIVITNLSRNWGQEAAIRAGLMTATGDCVIPMDADLQDPPEIIPEMAKLWEEGYEVVNAVRVSRQSDGSFKRNSAGLFYRYLDKISPKVKIPNNVNNFRLLDRKVVDKINSLTETNCVLRVEIPYLGFKTGYVEIVRQKRAKGVSHYPLSSMIKLAKDSIVSVSVKPLEIGLKLCVVFGCLFLASSITELVLFILHVLNKFAIGEVALWSWLAINVLLFISVFVFLVLGIQSIYVGKIAEESSHKPTVVISEVIRK